MSVIVTDQMRQLTRMLSVSLESCEAQILTCQRSDGYDDDRWNNRVLISIDVRPEFQALLSAAEDRFEQENRVLGDLERATGEALAWDEAGMLDLAPASSIGIYLLDDAQIAQVIAQVDLLARVSEQERAAALDVLGSS